MVRMEGSNSVGEEVLVSVKSYMSVNSLLRSPVFIMQISINGNTEQLQMLLPCPARR